jgi:hypothetical protein
VSDEFRIRLDESNSRVYRSKIGLPKQCHIRWEAAEYILSWGTQRFLGPHVVVIDANGDYGVELEVFFATHKPIPELRHHYVKVTNVRACRTAEPVRLVTQVKENTEMIALVPSGAYIVQNPSGELYAMSAEEFAARYEGVD